MNPTRRDVRFFWLPLSLLLALTLTGCVTQFKGVVRSDATATHGYRNLDDQAARSAVRVIRDGAPLADPMGARLQKGDVIETGTETSALLRFADGNEVILGPDTRVRLGSLEVFFGRVFASVRGAFVVHSDTVSAEVEGTEYLFEQPRAEAVRVVVLEGVVTCRSPQSRWADARIGAGRMFDLDYADGEAPRVVNAPPDVLLSTRRWVDAVRSTATPRFKLPFALNIGIGIGGGISRDRHPGQDIE